MIRPYALFLSATCLVPVCHGQTTLYSEDFDGGNSFSLNTTDAGSGISTWNTWVVNNSYNGGNGDVICLGFPFPYTIVSTSGQPAGIQPQNGNYLHTASTEGIADGITCCSFGAADGFCITADQTFSRMSNDVSTVGFANVDFKFWWLCSGSTTHYGQVFYSTNGGGSWTLISTPISNYLGQASWTQQTITLPDFGNQATLRFGFKFVNSIGGSALDPGFGIDNVEIIGQGGVVNSITTQVSSLTLCDGTGFSVDYAATGAYTPGNVFTAQLSDALGSFAAPVNIGSLASTTSGSIACTIPNGTAVGAGYRIRVVSSTPPTTGSDNGANITINNGASAGTDTPVSICKDSGIYTLLSLLSGNPDAGGTWTNPNNQVVSGSFDSAGQPGGNYTYTISNPPPCSPSVAVLSITLVDPANAGVGSTELICSTSQPVPMFSYLSGSPDATGYWLNPSNLVTDQLFDPQVDAPGLYAYVVAGINPCPNDTAFVELQIVTEGDAGISATATVCIGDPPVDLFTYLGGTPDVGGTWTDPNNQPHSSIFDQSTDPQGLYTYIVDPGAPCVAVSASVAVVIDPCESVLENGVDAVQFTWLGQRADGSHVFHIVARDCASARLTVLGSDGRSISDRQIPVVPNTETTVHVEHGALAAGTYLMRVELCSGVSAKTFVHVR